jgi:hypothetical protein
LTRLPPPQEQAELIRQVATLARAHGSAPWVSAPLLEPRPEHFPDPWRADALGVERLARRLLAYAGLPDLGVHVRLFANEAGSRTVDVRGGVTSSEHAGAAAWFAGIEDGRCLFGTDVQKLETPDHLAGIMAHEVAHAFRRFHRLERPERDVEERLTDLTTVFLGFGVLTTNAAYRYRASGDMNRTRWTHERVGYLAPEAMSFLLGAQVVARGLPAGERRRIARFLEPNQAAAFQAACSALDRAALLERLGLPPEAEWPAVVPPAPRPFDTSADPPPPDLPALAQAARQQQNTGVPVFRVGRHAQTRYLVLAFLPAAGAAVLAGWAASPLAGLAAACGVMIASGVLGRRRRHDRCSEPDCSAVIPANAERCPGCGGTISGRIEKQDDRLAARDELEDAESLHGSPPPLM